MNQHNTAVANHCRRKHMPSSTHNASVNHIAIHNYTLIAVRHITSH
jgi:hypothetical protein